MATLYCVPGLGTDERIFSKLFPRLPHHEKVVLNYIKPLNYKESLTDYARRLGTQIPPQEGNEPLILVGFSLGGPIAVEIAKQHKNVVVILLATYKQNKETPIFFKMARIFPLYRLIPVWYTHQFIPRMASLVGSITNENIAILTAMFRSKSALHYSWGREAIVNWKNEEIPDVCWHLNGDKDHIFNSALPHVDERIKGGTHIMLLERADEIAAWMRMILDKTLHKALH